jgi:tellurite resistance protein
MSRFPGKTGPAGAPALCGAATSVNAAGDFSLRQVGALPTLDRRGAEVMMKKPSAHEAMIYMMVITSASDRDMTDDELARIGLVIRLWPVFLDFDEDDLIAVAQDCQKRLNGDAGLESVLEMAANAIPARLHDTAYALAVEVANVDLEMRLEELRVLQRLRRHLKLDEATATAIQRAGKARHRMLT